MDSAVLASKEDLRPPPRHAQPFRVALIASTVAALLATLLVPASAASAEPVSLHGSTTIIVNIVAPHKAEIEAASGQQLEIVGNGSQRGIADLLSGKAQIAMISTPLDAEIKKFSEIQPGAIGNTHFKAYPVGELRVAFVVNPSNTVRSVSDAHLAGLLTGKIKRWSELGGSDQPVVVVAAQPGDGVRTTVETTFLKGTVLTADARAMPNVAQVPKVVAQMPNSIGLIALSGVDHTVVELKGMSVVRLPLSLVVIGEPAPAIRQVIDAIARAGEPQ